VHRIWSFALLVALSSCSPQSEGKPPRVRTHHIGPVGSLVQMLQVELERPAPLRVEYWTRNAPRLVVDSKAAATHKIPLTRLRADRTYLYRIVGTDAHGAFITGTLPVDLARVQLHASGLPSIPLVMLHLYDPHGFRGYAAVDADGEIVWFRRTDDMALGATRRANGHAVFLDAGRGLVEVRPDGSVVHELPQDTVTREQHHDVIVTPQDTLLFLAYDQRRHAGALVKGEAIWEWTPETGHTVKRWSSWDHLSPDHDRGPRSDAEWLHANSLALGPRGNVLMSVHFLNQVISISPDFQRVEWRLGAVNATRSLAVADRYSGPPRLTLGTLRSRGGTERPRRCTRRFAQCQALPGGSQARRRVRRRPSSTRRGRPTGGRHSDSSVRRGRLRLA
jgi:arylsulfotransferase ASST